jgi:hypothetical protein
VVARDEAALFGFLKRGFDRRHGQPRALDEAMHRKAFHEAQRVEHELEGQIVRAHLVFFLHRRAGARLLDECGRMLVARLPQHAMRKRELRVCARADAEVVAEAPVIEVVLALPVRFCVRRDLVVSVPRCGHVLVNPVLHVRGRVVVGQCRRKLSEQGVGLERQVV